MQAWLDHFITYLINVYVDNVFTRLAGPGQYRYSTDSSISSTCPQSGTDHYIYTGPCLVSTGPWLHCTGHRAHYQHWHNERSGAGLTNGSNDAHLLCGFNCRPEQIFALHSALPHCILGTDPAAAAGAWTVKYTSNNNNYNKDIMYIEHIHHALLLLMSSKSLPISNQPKNI